MCKWDTKFLILVLIPQFHGQDLDEFSQLKSLLLTRLFFRATAMRPEQTGVLFLQLWHFTVILEVSSANLVAFFCCLQGRCVKLDCFQFLLIFSVYFSSFLLPEQRQYSFLSISLSYRGYRIFLYQWITALIIYCYHLADLFDLKNCVMTAAAS